MTTQDKINAALGEVLYALVHICESKYHSVAKDEMAHIKIAEAHVEKARRLMEGENG